MQSCFVFVTFADKATERIKNSLKNKAIQLEIDDRSTMIRSGGGRKLNDFLQHFDCLLELMEHQKQILRPVKFDSDFHGKILSIRDKSLLCHCIVYCSAIS